MKKSIKTPTIVILVFIVILTSIFYKSIGVKKYIKETKNLKEELILSS